MKKAAIVSLILATVVSVGCAKQEASKPAGGDKPAETAVKSNFPQKPIEMVVPFAPGGATDSSARILAASASKYLPNGQSIAVTNKAGGGATIGVTDVFMSKPDGYKIGFVTSSPLSIQPNYGQAAYTHDSFQPIMRALSFSQVLVVKSDSPWKTFDEWLDYVKKNPNKFIYGTSGTGSIAHIAMEALNNATGIQSKHVPFDGSAPALTALLGGHIQGAVVLPTDINSDSVRILANFGSLKSDAYKDVPTLMDKGIQVKQDVYSGLIAPKGLPKDVLQVLQEAFKKALEDPATVEQLKKIGLAPAYLGPEEFQKEITDSFKMSGEVMKKAGLIK